MDAFDDYLNSLPSERRAKIERRTDEILAATVMATALDNHVQDDKTNLATRETI